MSRKTVLFLYTEFSSYLECCINELLNSSTIDFHLVRYPVNKEAPFHFNNLNFSCYCRSEFNSKKELLNFTLKLNPDLLLVSGWIDKDYLYVASNIKTSLKIMAMDTQWRGSIKQRVFSKFTFNYFTKRFNYIWVPGERQKKFAKKIGFNSENILTDFYSCDVSLFKNYYLKSIDSKRDDYPKVFLFFGRYIPNKCINELCEIFKEISFEQDHDWQLWCVGKGDQWDNRITHPKIKHWGFLQPSQLNELISKCGVYVLPSKFEPWGVSLHEFVSAGFPIIASDKVGSADKFLKNKLNGFLFNSASKNGLKEAMLRMMQMSSEEMLAMSKESLILSKKITPEIWGNKLKSLL